jgi:hypothetical protein
MEVKGRRLIQISNHMILGTDVKGSWFPVQDIYPDTGCNRTEPVSRLRFLPGNVRFRIQSTCICHLSSGPPTFLIRSLGEYSVVLVVAHFTRFVKIICSKRKLGKMHHRNIPIGILRINLSKTGPQRGLNPVHDHDNLQLCVHAKG